MHRPAARGVDVGITVGAAGQRVVAASRHLCLSECESDEAGVASWIANDRVGTNIVQVRLESHGSEAPVGVLSEYGRSG